MGALLESTKLIKEYLKKYPDTKDYTLAKKIYEENRHLFKDLERVRWIVRYHRGHGGESKRRLIKDTKFIKPLNYDTRNTILEIPSYAPKLKTFKLPVACDNVLFLTDPHFPYQDNDALLAAIEYGLEQKVNTIWLNGDIMDMYQESDHEKLPNKATIADEFEITRGFFMKLRKLFPKAAIYYKEGNHERRWLRYLMRKAVELLGTPEFELPVILRLKEFKIEWIPNETLVKFGKLNVIHGNEFKGGGGVNPARTLFLRAKANVIAGDKHKTGENNEGDLNGKLITTWSVGALCDLNAEYMPFAHTTWNHGFAHIKLNKDDFHVKNFRIHNGKIL